MSGPPVYNLSSLWSVKFGLENWYEIIWSGPWSEKLIRVQLVRFMVPNNGSTFRISDRTKISDHRTNSDLYSYLARSAHPCQMRAHGYTKVEDSQREFFSENSKILMEINF